jgi:Putative transposase
VISRGINIDDAERRAQTGAVSSIQRFDSALRLNLHIHSLVIDGVYTADDNDA